MANALSLAAGSRTAGRRTTRRKKNTGGSQLQKSQQTVARLQNKLKNMNVSAKDGMNSVVHSLEFQAGLAGAAYAHGRMGEAKLKLFNIDGRLLLGGALLAWGLSQTWTGHADAGSHFVSLGNGVVGSLVYELAHEAGIKGAKPAGFGYDAGDVEMGREVFVTPEMGRSRRGL